MARQGAVELRHLRYFATIAEQESFTGAAERLRVSQPALSRQMQDLEDELGRRLFEREPDGVRLTPAGRRFLKGARRVLAACEALLADTRTKDGVDKRPLQIANFGTLSAQFFTPFLRKLIRRFPSLRLNVDEEIPRDALKRLHAGTLDAAFMGAPPPRQLRGLDLREIWMPVQEVLMAANHRLAKRRRVTLAELKDEPWGLWDEKRFPGFAQPVIDSCARAGFRMRVKASLDSLAAVFLHVAEGNFIGHAPDIARSLTHPGVVFVPTEPPHAIQLPVALIWRKDSPHAEVLNWLADTMGSAHRANLKRRGLLPETT